MIAKLFDKTLRGNWYFVYLLDMVAWFVVGYICGGGTV
jgi:hypothetical protein